MSGEISNNIEDESSTLLKFSIIFLIMTTNQQDNYNILLDSLIDYRQIAKQLQDILNSTNTQNHGDSFPNYNNNNEFTSNINETSITSNKDALQNSTF